MADFEGAIKQHSQWGREGGKKGCELMKQVKQFYGEKKKNLPSIFGLSVQKEVLSS